MAADNLKNNIGSFWDSWISRKADNRTRWWQSQTIISHINKIVCGESIPGLNEGSFRLLQSKSNGKIFDKALSIGCGNARKEFKLVKSGIVNHFYLYDFSTKSCKIAFDRFKKDGMEDNVTIINDDFFKQKNTDTYDLVYWDNSLHHMFDSHDAISRTYDCLRSGGFFFMDDFVGKTRFQWTDEELHYVNMFRNSLPDSVFTFPNGVLLSREVQRPSVQTMIDNDPSEAADSDSIIPSLKKVLDNPDIIPTGGAIYHSGLNNILTNIPENSPLLSHALKIDAKLTDQGIYQYAVCISKK